MTNTHFYQPYERYHQNEGEQTYTGDNERQHGAWLLDVFLRVARTRYTFHEAFMALA